MGRIIFVHKKLLNFETYAAPSDFDRTSQPVDIYDLFEKYYRVNRTAKWIYSVADTFTTNIGLSANETPTMNGTSYHYGYEISGVSYRYDLSSTTSTGVPFNYYTGITVTSTDGFPNSGKIIVGNYYSAFYQGKNSVFSYTSKDSTHFYGPSQQVWGTDSSVNPVISWVGTKRWVIVNHTTMTPMTCSHRTDNGAIWLYCGDLIKDIDTTSGSIAGTSAFRYIHIHRLDNITNYGYGCHWQTPLTGNLYISRSATQIGNYIPNIYDYGGSFNNCPLLTGTLVIPENIKSISSSSFYNCGFTRIEFSEGLEYLRPGSLYGLKKITSMNNFPSTLKEIGSQSFFSFGENNGNVNIPLNITSGITSIGVKAFAYSRFTPLVSNAPNYLVEDNTIYDVTSGITKALHSDFTSTGSINLKSGTTIVLDYCFINSLRSGNLNLLNTITEIKENAFSSARYLTGELNTNNINTIGSGSFYNCVSFTGLTLGSDLTHIGDAAFSALIGVTTNLVIPDSVTYIGSQAFRDWRSTGTLTLPNSSCILRGYTFYNSWFSGTLNIPSNITTIEESTFANCSNFNDVTSSNINYPVFDHVLYDIKTVGQIKANYNPRMYSNSLTLSGGTTHILDYCFSSSLRGGTLTIPTSVTSIAQYSFFNSTGFTGNLEIPVNTNITSSWTFSGCIGFRDSLIIRNPSISVYYNSSTVFEGMVNIGRDSGGIELPSGYSSSYLDFSFSNYLSSTDSGYTLNQSILNITDGTIGSPKTVKIGATNKNRLLTYYPSAETDANARNILII